MRLLLSALLLCLAQLLQAQCNPPVTIAPIPTLCNGDQPYQLTATPAGGLWSGKQISPDGLLNPYNLFGNWTATYIYSDSSCTDTITANFLVIPSPGVNAGTDFSVVCGGEARVNGGFTPGPHNVASWSTTDGHFIDPLTDMNARVDKPGTYILTAIDTSTGCMRRDTTVCYPYLPSFPHTEITDTICPGDTLLGYTTSGHFYEKYETGAPCDSFRVVHLTVLSPLRDTLIANTCDNLPVAGYSQTGIYTDTFQAVSGCDSIRVLDLTVLPTFQTMLNFSTCDPAQVGIFQTILSAINGCDSVITTIVELLPSTDTTISATICNGEIYEEYDQTGVYTNIFTNQFGCDSIRVIDLSVLPLPEVLPDIQPDHGMNEGTIALTSLAGTPPFQYVWSTGDTTIALSGLGAGDYSLTLTDANGCSAVFNFTVPFTVSAKDLANTSFSINVSPNPVRTGTAVTFHLTAPESGDFRVAVFTATGSCFREFIHPHSGASSNCAVRLQQPGLYWARFANESGQTIWARIVVI